MLRSSVKPVTHTTRLIVDHCEWFIPWVANINFSIYFATTTTTTRGRHAMRKHRTTWTGFASEGKALDYSSVEFWEHSEWQARFDIACEEQLCHNWTLAHSFDFFFSHGWRWRLRTKVDSFCHGPRHGRCLVLFFKIPLYIELSTKHGRDGTGALGWHLDGNGCWACMMGWT